MTRFLIKQTALWAGMICWTVYFTRGGAGAFVLAILCAVAHFATAVYEHCAVTVCVDKAREEALKELEQEKLRKNGE